DFVLDVFCVLAQDDFAGGFARTKSRESSLLLKILGDCVKSFIHFLRFDFDTHQFLAGGQIFDCYIHKNNISVSESETVGGGGRGVKLGRELRAASFLLTFGEVWWCCIAKTASHARLNMRKKILLVEDNTELLELLCMNCEDAGLSTATATNGVEALEKARSISPDLIILDLVLPELDGFAVCETLRKDPATATVPIIM